MNAHGMALIHPDKSRLLLSGPLPSEDNSTLVDNQELKEISRIRTVTYDVFESRLITLVHFRTVAILWQHYAVKRAWKYFESLSRIGIRTTQGSCWHDQRIVQK